MSSSSLLKSAVFSALVIVIVSGCRDKSTDRYPFNRDRAAAHVRPYTVLERYIKAFGPVRDSLYRRVNDPKFIDNSFDLPNAEMFNKDAILALLNAPGAEGIRIYLGKKTTNDSTNGNIVLVLLPVDKNNNDIKAQLLTIDQRGAVVVPGLSSASAQDQSARRAEGVEDGQRCPQICTIEN